MDIREIEGHIIDISAISFVSKITKRKDRFEFICVIDGIDIIFDNYNFYLLKNFRNKILKFLFDLHSSQDIDYDIS